MGIAVDDLQTPILKGTCGVLALTPEEVAAAESGPLYSDRLVRERLPARPGPGGHYAHQIGASPAELAALWPDYCVECGECEVRLSLRPALAGADEAGQGDPG